MKNNKILIIILAIVLVLSVGVGSYFIFDSIYNKEPETNNDLNNQTGNNNVNNETNNNNRIEKTSIEILNDLVKRGYLKESDLASKEDYESFAYINNKGQFVIKDVGNDENSKEIVATKIEGKVSKVDLLHSNGGAYGFLVITEDGRLYSQRRNFDYGTHAISKKEFEEIKLPSKIKKIYEREAASVNYYILLENNEAYELIEGDTIDIKLGDKLSNNTFIEELEVSSYPGGGGNYPYLKFSYDGKTYLDNETSIYELKDDNNNSISTNYVIYNAIYNYNDDGLILNKSHVNAYIVDKNNNIYVIPKVSVIENGEQKTNTDIKKYSSKKVKTVSNDSDDNQVIVTYVDGSKEKLDGYYISMNK